MYIYTIKNLINGKMYVGQTVQSNPKMRWYSHQADARKGKKSHLYDSMRKHGVETFLWKVVETTTSLDKLNELEKTWADQLRAQGITLYNNRETGNNRTHSPESIEKMRWVKREEHARRRAEGREGGWERIDGGPMKGKKHNEYTRMLMSQSAYTREARKRGEL